MLEAEQGGAGLSLPVLRGRAQFAVLRFAIARLRAASSLPHLNLEMNAGGL
jgi:hypothetical protein